MKKLNILILLGSFLLIIMPFKANALTNLGKVEGNFEKINNKMYDDFASDSYLKFYKHMYYVKWLKDGNNLQIAYCIGINTGFTDNSNYTDAGAVDVGIQYIIKNGFTGTENGNQTYHYSTNNDACSSLYCPSLVDLKTNYPKANTPWYDNYWLTQVAIWVYQGESHSSLNELKEILNGGNLTANQQIIKNLVDGANQVKNNGTNFAVLNPQMTVSKSNLELVGGYYYSKIINTSGTGDTFSVSASNSNYEIVDANKNPKTTFNKDESFYVRISEDKVTKNGEVTLTLSTQGDTFANKYVNESGLQEIAKYVVAKAPPKTVTLKLNVVAVIKDCDVNIKVVDSVTKEKICGGTLKVLDSAGNVAKNANGDVVGNIQLSKTKCEVTLSLPKGNYRVVQESAIDPYIKDNNEYEVNTETTCPAAVELKNEEVKDCDVNIKVVDSITKEKICGGTLKVLDSTGNVAKNSKGDAVGNIELSETMCEVTLSLPKGNYRVVQESAINPYIKDNNEYEVNTVTTCPVTIELENEKLYQIKVLKISEREDNPIADAVLKLEDSNGTVIKEFTTTKEPIIIDNLHRGIYYLSEVKAPAGYALSEEKIEIEVNEENNNKEFYFNNNEIIVPSTGFNSGLLLISLGFGAIGVCILLYAKKSFVIDKSS